MLAVSALGFFSPVRLPPVSPCVAWSRPAVLRTTGVALQQDRWGLQQDKLEDERLKDEQDLDRWKSDDTSETDFGSDDGRYYETPSSGYCREEGDEAPIDETLVEELLAERNELRRERDYDGADAVREEISKMGVTILDRRKIWFVRRSVPGRKYTRLAGDTADVDTVCIEELVAERDSMRRTRRYAKADGLRAKLCELGVVVDDEKFSWAYDPEAAAIDGQGYGGGGRGSRGYSRDPGCEADLDDEFVALVEKMVAERGEFRRLRDFAAADEAKAKLWEMGVSLLDKQHTWYVAKPKGEKRVVNGQIIDKSKFGPVGHDYKRAMPRGAGTLGDLDEALVDKINRLLGERLEAKLARNFAQADTLRDDLSALGVSIHERRKEWTYTPSDLRARYAPLGHDYTRAEEDKSEIDETTLEAINLRLSERLSAKFRRDFRSADRLREELEGEYGVSINDQGKTWRADGIRDRNFGSGGRGIIKYERVEGDADESLGGDSDEALISSMLEERAQARALGNYGKSDELQARLRNAYNVAVDDKIGKWWLALMPGGYYCIGPKPAPEIQAQVDALLEKRAAVKGQADSDFKAADGVNEELLALGVVVDERTKTWRFTPYGVRGK